MAALQAALQGFAADRELARVVGGNHAREIRKLAFDQLGHQLDVAETETDLARRHVQRHRLVGVLEQALHFQHRLARHDDLMALGDAVGLGGAVRQAVAVGGHGAHTARLEHQQHAIEVVADILLGHGEVHHVEQVAQHALRHAQRHVPLFGLGHGRELAGRQRLQCEAALGRLHRQLVAGQAQLDLAGVRQGLQDVEQLARRHRGGLVLRADAEVGMRGDLDLEVGGDESHLVALFCASGCSPGWAGYGVFRRCPPQSTAVSAMHRVWFVRVAWSSF